MLSTGRCKVSIAMVLMSLSACTPPQTAQPPQVLMGVNAIPGVMGSSVFPAACLGLLPSRGLSLHGHTLFDVVVSVRDRAGATVFKSWAPAIYGESRSTRVERLARDGRPQCGGGSFSTELLRAADGDILRWSLELAAPDNSEQGSVVQVINGETPIGRNGYMTSPRLPFVVNGNLLTAEVSATRGAYGIVLDGRNQPAQETRAFSTGSPLPDEMPGRTLDDMRRDGQLRSRN